MTAGASPALALLRLPRGHAAPTEAECRAALLQDRERLRQIDNGVPTEVVMTGPHPINADGAEVDEYLIWER